MKKATSIKIAASSVDLSAEYLAGATIRSLGKKYGCSFQNINIRLITFGVAMRPNSVRKMEDRVCPTCGKTFRPHARKQVFCCKGHVRNRAVCKRGHILSEDNRYHYPGANSRCKQCQSIRCAAYRARKKQAT